MDGAHTMDTGNPVVRLCMKGMRAESEGRPAEARDLCVQAWDARRDDFDACIAAHYLARHQDTIEATFRWNQEALSRADAVPDDRVRGFYPSLYLNLGKSFEDRGDASEARRYYALAADRISALPAGPYRDLVQHGIAEGQRRTAIVA